MTNQRRILLALLALGMIVALIIGCGVKQPKGLLTPNQSPEVHWADIPIDSTRYTRNPTIKWWGTDIDGKIEVYGYTILLADFVTDNGGPEAILNSFPDTSTWTAIDGNTTQTRVFLYSSQDTSLYIDQYVFLKAIDDDNASSSIIYLFLSRKNHPPTCRLVLPDSTQWCLPETTASWRGMAISWEGKDSIDYPGVQPDFQWQIRAYGPFADSASADTLPGHINGWLRNPETGSEWVSLKSYKFKGFRTGWYMMYARNRDDALVPAEVPAMGTIHVFEPQWIRNTDYKKILLVDHNSYVRLRPGDLPVRFADSLKQFYSQLVEAAGYTSEEYDWSPNDSTVSIIDKDLMYNYRMVIAVNSDGYIREISEAQRQAYMKYLDVGGNLWVIGRRSFVPRVSEQHKVFLAPTLQYRYLDLQGVFSPMVSRTFAEFVGATPLISDFPELAVDTLRVAQSSDTLSGNNVIRYSQALRGVETLIIANSDRGISETIYLYRALNPDTSQYVNLPVATRFTAPGFKTSYFSFPLYFIQRSSAEAVTQRMLEWFLGPRP